MTTSRNLLRNTTICEFSFCYYQRKMLLPDVLSVYCEWLSESSQSCLSLLIDLLKNAIRRAKAEINIIYWGEKLPSGQRNLKSLRFCPRANAWQTIIMYFQGYGLFTGKWWFVSRKRLFFPPSSSSLKLLEINSNNTGNRKGWTPRRKQVSLQTI